MALTRSRLQTLQRAANIGFRRRIEQAVVHGYVLQLTFHSSSAGFLQTIWHLDRGGMPRILGNRQTVSIEKPKQGFSVPHLGRDDIHEWPDRAETFDDAAVGRDRLTFIIQRLGQAVQ